MDTLSNITIDENLYSRQLYVLGHDAMRKMQNSNILISGMGGLGVEIAKNIILGGVKSVTIHDQKNVSNEDLSTQFFLKESDIGKNRAVCSHSSLAELNSYVTVNYHADELNEDFIKKFQVVILTDSGKEEKEIGMFCHRSGIKLIIADTKGIFGKIFCDFGPSFKVLDVNGQASKCIMISYISRDREGVVTTFDDKRHDLEDGDYVTINEVKGMIEVNGKEFKIKVTGPFSFTIGDTSNFGQFENGGIAVEVKKEKIIDFKPINLSIESPEYLISDYTKMADNDSIHLAFETISKFKDLNGSLPKSWNKDDAESFINLVKSVNSNMKKPFECLNVDLLRLFSYVSNGSLCPIQAIIGGLAAQEAIKACSGKFHPIFQYFYYDCRECLPENYENLIEQMSSSCQENNRYVSQIAVFGKDFQEKLENLVVFLVGSGALGCEYIKNFAMMGVSCGENGKLTVTDMDNIEKSNLNRQFLFRSWDVQKPKAQVSSRAAKNMNSKINVYPNLNRVGIETEQVYDENFFESLDIVCNALDNVKARLYIDSKCIEFRKPLIESGTLGTEANTQVILPHLTEAYSSSRDPPEKAIPLCTVKNFPVQIEHCIQWARDKFTGLFSNSALTCLNYIKDPKGFLQSKSTNQQRLDELEQLERILIKEKCITFEDCICWARNNWQENFHNIICQLLYNFPPDEKTSNGMPFWSGLKKCPHPLEFDMNNQLHIDYIVAAANLKAFMHSISQIKDKKQIIEVLNKVKLVEEFKPISNQKINVNESEPDNESFDLNDEDEEKIQKLTKFFEENHDKIIKNVNLIPVEFEKDDDSNSHIDFITACSNLRAENYDIASTDKHNAKLIAGKIIPAIATTTAVIVGLDCIELFKIVQGHKKLEFYKNSYLNLALPFFSSTEPMPVTKTKSNGKEWTLWDRIDVKGDITLKEFIDHFKNEHNLVVNMINQDLVTIYSDFLSASKKNERMSMKITEILETIKKEKLPNHKKSLQLSLSCCDIDDNDVEIPIIKYSF